MEYIRIKVLFAIGLLSNFSKRNKIARQVISELKDILAYIDDYTNSTP